MKEKLRFLEKRLKVEVSEIEEYQDMREKISKPIEREERKQQIEVSVYDVLFEQFAFPAKLELLDTKVKEIMIKQITMPLSDTSIAQQVIKQPSQMPLTNLIQIQIPKETIKISDIGLLTVNVDQLSTSLSTEVKSTQVSAFKAESIASIFDISLLKSKEILEQTSKLDTQLITMNIESSLETLAYSQKQLPIFEEFIKCDKRFPRGFSESFNSPFVVLIGEDEKEWHIPIIYALKELFHEITDKYPRITFRESELSEEGLEEVVDSLDLHSLDQFTFEYKIEFLDARRMYFAVDEFVKMVRGRLKSGFLQQFGVLIIAVKPGDLEKAKNALKIEGLRVYTCKPENESYEVFCSKILGLSSPDKFFEGLRKYEKYLEYTNRQFSIFVKRSADAADKFQYPLKVATFVYLLNDLRGRRKKVINDFEELCKFVNEIMDKEIKVESPISNGKIIPDIIYSPDGKEIYIEIETLIGTIEPLKKVDETIEKYKDCPQCQIWVVLKPVSALLHYEELKARERAYRIIYSDKEIKFKVLTFLASKERFKWNLMSIDEFVGDKNVK
jgi:hypothetical protein